MDKLIQNHATDYEFEEAKQLFNIIATERETTEANLKIQELREVISARINIEIVKQ